MDITPIKPGQSARTLVSRDGGRGVTSCHRALPPASPLLADFPTVTPQQPADDIISFNGTRGATRIQDAALITSRQAADSMALFISRNRAHGTACFHPAPVQSRQAAKILLTCNRAVGMTDLITP